MDKPDKYISWVEDNDPNKIVEPSSELKNTGYVDGDEPLPKNHNWIFNIADRFVKWLSGGNENWIVCGGLEKERKYPSFAGTGGYLENAPAAGDSVFVKGDETLGSKTQIPDGIKLKQLKGKKFSVTAALAEVFEIGSGVHIEGDLLIECAHPSPGVISEVVSWEGDSSNCENITVKNTSTGDITNAFVVNGAKESNIARGEAINTGAGSITNVLVDNSGVDSNDIRIRGDV